MRSLQGFPDRGWWSALIPLGGTVCYTPGGTRVLPPCLDLQALDLPEQLGGILVKLHEVYRFAAASAFSLHHHLLLAGDAAVWWQV